MLGGAKRKYASVGDVIVVTIKEAIPRGKVKKGEVRRAVIVRTAKQIQRQDGSSIKFDTNAAVLLSNSGEPIGTRIFGPVVRELRLKKFMKMKNIKVLLRRSNPFILEKRNDTFLLIYYNS